MLYADDLCIVSLSSAGLQQLLSICDQYCAMHSIIFNVKKSVCMFFRCSMNKSCDITNVVFSGNIIDYVHKTKYLGVLLCSDMKTSIDVCRTSTIGLDRNVPSFHARGLGFEIPLSFTGI